MVFLTGPFKGYCNNAHLMACTIPFHGYDTRSYSFSPSLVKGNLKTNNVVLLSFAWHIIMHILFTKLTNIPLSLSLADKPAEKPLKLMTGAERRKYYREKKRAKAREWRRAYYQKTKPKRDQKKAEREREKAEREREKAEREEDLPKRELTKEEKRKEYKRMWIQKKRAE